jgi:hypothetical protein
MKTVEKGYMMTRKTGETVSKKQGRMRGRKHTRDLVL